MFNAQVVIGGCQNNAMEALVKLSSVRTIASCHVKAKNESSREISRQITATRESTGGGQT